MKLSEALRIIFSIITKNGFNNLILSFLNLVFEPEKMTSYPFFIQIEPTIYCNLRCVMCGNPLSKRKKRHMLFDEFKNIIDAMPFLKKISLTGAGESLLNPYLFDMIAYVKSKGILVGFATNGMLLNRNVCKNIIESRVDWVNISVDSFCKENYERIRQGGNFEILLDNIRSLVHIKANNRSPEISFWFVLMKDNFKDLLGVIKLAKKIGIDKVSAQLEHSWSNEQIKSKMMDRRAGDFQNNMKDILTNAKNLSKKIGVEFDYVNVPDMRLNRACKWPWKSCYITAEGYVTPCCLQGSNPGKINFGNIFENSFSEIWNNADYQEFRWMLKSDSPPEICVGCTSYHKKIKI